MTPRLQDSWTLSLAADEGRKQSVSRGTSEGLACIFYCCSAGFYILLFRFYKFIIKTWGEDVCVIYRCVRLVAVLSLRLPAVWLEAAKFDIIIRTVESSPVKPTTTMINIKQCSPHRVPFNAAQALDACPATSVVWFGCQCIYNL